MPAPKERETAERESTAHAQTAERTRSAARAQRRHRRERAPQMLRGERAIAEGERRTCADDAATQDRLRVRDAPLSVASNKTLDKLAPLFGIFVGQATRLRRVCSEDIDYVKHLHEIKSTLVSRNHPVNSLDQAL